MPSEDSSHSCVDSINIYDDLAVISARPDASPSRSLGGAATRELELKEPCLSSIAQAIETSDVGTLTTPLRENGSARR